MSAGECSGQMFDCACAGARRLPEGSHALAASRQQGRERETNYEGAAPLGRQLRIRAPLEARSWIEPEIRCLRGFPLAHVEKAAATLVSKGFRQMKTQLALPGDTNPEKEVERIRVVRNAIGPEIDLMCDINQRWDVRQAISIGKRVEEYHLFWLEDVTAHDDYPGLARVAAALDTPVAGGEYVYGSVPFRHMLGCIAHDADKP